LCFIALWLAITSVLALISGWYALASRYPDRHEEPNLSLSFQSGSMNGVSMRGILMLDACPSGLRVGIWRLFGPFSRKFFVPWDQIRIERKNRLFWTVAKLRFGDNCGNLTVFGNVADRLARSIPGRWPEPGPFPEETKAQALWSVTKIWAAGTLFAASFFIIAPRVALTKGAAFPPIAVAILFPAIAFAIPALFNFFARIRR